jgi:uncharacterized damage-inducible protein DinB
MNGQQAAERLRQERRFLMNVVEDFKPEHGDFAPLPEMFTVSQQIRHIAADVRWFQEGAFGKGFDLDFASMERQVRTPATLEQALAELNKAYDDFIEFLETLTERQLLAPLDENPILGTQPRYSVLYANADHTAHHRGALTVYLRLLGIKPKLVYQ